MNKKLAALLIFIFLTACAPLDIETPYTPVTQIPFYASDTPAPFIVPVTETPQIIFPVTETPTLEQPVFVTDTPFPVAKWWEVYFTEPLTINDLNNPAGSIEEKLINFINAAQVSIHIASFEFNLPRVADALIAAKARGVDVRWVTDDENGLEIDGNANRGQFTRLMAAGVEVKDDAGRTALMHNKFWLFDRQITWTGSTNITVNGIYKQNNNVIVIHSPEVTEIYEREWEELWTAQLGPRAPSTKNNQWAILDGTPLQILFSAEDDAVDSLIAILNDAQVSIRFLAFSFTDYPMAQAMIARAQAGVDVQGIFETFGSNSTRAELKTLWCAGLPVRQDGNSSFLHDKVIIVDNSIVVTGSLNFSSSADEENEENVVILDNPEIAALYLQEYQKLWDQAMSVPTGAFTCE
ncbi:MAG TPA: phospholipase D-like domain-containing protein [Anaerolineales bacterium]|nr:phospholipase D-like domain-containing protein [Anaerolineales bacterium]HNH26260.1 phospholipase D-like domain-containing protein [Anaerolineales bacterium]